MMQKSLLLLLTFLIMFGYTNSFADNDTSTDSNIDEKLDNNSNIEKNEIAKEKQSVGAIKDSNAHKGFRKGSCAAAYAGIWFDFTFKDCLKEVDSGDLEAKYILGRMYLLGWGIKQDVPRALYLWQQIAEQGMYNVFYNIANVYSDGINRPKDYVKAYAYYAVSAAVGNKAAKKNLVMFKKLFLKDKKSLDEAIELSEIYISQMLPDKFHKK